MPVITGFWKTDLWMWCPFVEDTVLCCVVRLVCIIIKWMSELVQHILTVHMIGMKGCPNTVVSGCSSNLGNTPKERESVCFLQTYCPHWVFLLVRWQIYPVGLDSLQDPSCRRFRKSLQDESIQQGQMETHTNEYKIQAIPIRWVTMVIFAWVTL